jgi:hypothetical protein
MQTVRDFVEDPEGVEVLVEMVLDLEELDLER